MDLYDTWINSLPATTFQVAVFCTVFGVAILSLYTQWLGLPLILINTTVLFIGAYLANLLTARLNLPLERMYVKPLVMSFIGMALSSMLLLLFFPRRSDTE